MTPSKPREIISFFPADMSFNDDGSLMIYIALDSYSDFLFNLGSANADTDLNILAAIQRLMKNKDFNRI